MAIKVPMPPDAAMSSFSLGVSTAGFPWNICAPVVYRYLEKREFVEQFFADGSLRLASIEKFRKHEDERRLDSAEGWALFVHSTEERGGQAFTMWTGFGQDGYVLCASARSDAEIGKKFGDSFIEISDPTQFGIAVAKRIPGIVAGYEGSCRYVEMRGIRVDLGYIDFETLKNEKGEIDGNRLFNMAHSTMKYWPAFMKHVSFVAEMEYRFLWLTNEALQPTLDIKVPEAIQFCKAPPSITAK